MILSNGWKGLPRELPFGRAILLLVVIFTGRSSTVLADDRPNIVVILCDDLGYGDLSCYGHPHIETPHLDGLAATGIRLTSCYSAAPVCSPSRVGLLTGRSPNRAGVYDWIPPAGKPRADARDLVHMRASEATIAKQLQGAGYATCMSGKWHCNSQFNRSAQPQPDAFGFDHWFGTQNNASPSHQNPNNYVRNGKPVGDLEGFSCQIASDEASAWVQEHSKKSPNQPFFLYLAFHEPHEPVASPRELVEKYLPVARDEDEAQYFANVENMDLAVGKFIATLEKIQKRENTLIVFSSDNGPETLDRYARANRSYGRATPLRGMKLWTTDAGFRVAGVLNWPRAIKQSSVSDSVLSALDFMPTFCELAKAELPDCELDGASFTPMLAGKEIQREKPLLWCYYNATNERQVAMRHGKWKMLARLVEADMNAAIPKLQNVHAGNVDGVHAAILGGFQLFDVSRDIAEENDLMQSAANAAQVRELMIARYDELTANSHVWRR